MMALEAPLVAPEPLSRWLAATPNAILASPSTPWARSTIPAASKAQSPELRPPFLDHDMRAPFRQIARHIAVEPVFMPSQGIPN
jgi:hypothetical protein